MSFAENESGCECKSLTLCINRSERSSVDDIALLIYLFLNNTGTKLWLINFLLLKYFNRKYAALIAIKNPSHQKQDGLIIQHQKLFYFQH